MNDLNRNLSRRAPRAERDCLSKDTLSRKWKARAYESGPHLKVEKIRPSLRGIAVDRCGRKGGETDGNVFGPLRARRAVSNPFASRRDDRLPGMDIEVSRFRFHMKHAAQNQRVLIKLGSLSRFDPSGRTLHSSQAYVRGV